MRVYTAPYVYIEYPKWITLPDGRKVIVQSREQEHQFLQRPEPQIKRRGRRPKVEQ